MHVSKKKKKTKRVDDMAYGKHGVFGTYAKRVMRDVHKDSHITEATERAVIDPMTERLDLTMRHAAVFAKRPSGRSPARS